MQQACTKFPPQAHMLLSDLSRLTSTSDLSPFDLSLTPGPHRPSVRPNRVKLAVPFQILVQVYVLRCWSRHVISIEICDTCCAPRQQLLSSSSAQQLS
eukprot:1918376-Prymnesium_polylepis.1